MAVRYKCATPKLRTQIFNNSYGFFDGISLELQIFNQYLCNRHRLMIKLKYYSSNKIAHLNEYLLWASVQNERLFQRHWLNHINVIDKLTFILGSIHFMILYISLFYFTYLSINKARIKEIYRY